MNNTLSFITAWWKTIGVSAIILLLSLLPGNSFPNTPPIINDKIVHFGLYLGLTWVLLLDLDKNKYRHLLAITYTICFGALMEILQALTPTRSADIYDLIANILGTLCAVTFSQLFIAIKKQR